MSLENCEVEKDITSFIQERGTGQEIPDPPKYINFCRGDLNDTASEASEDESYSVAQFQRTINPSFRSSSPQPSTYESHHDPQSELSVRTNQSQGQQNPRLQAGHDTLNPPKAVHKPPPPFDYRRQVQPPSQLHFKRDDLPAVPHNEYPTDGMTMFCRTDGPSEQSSVGSPVRPSSRDSHSDYSNPTSLSSIEPANGKLSPTKQVASRDNQPVSPAKQVQKRRSGFFSNSPFRRKSKHEKDNREDVNGLTTTPRSARTWGPSSAQNGDASNSSPSRMTTETRDFATEGSHSPEPADPRASFQLNIGRNTFNVASPDSHRKPQSSKTSNQQKELDPIAAALAELKGVTKQSSVRMSADRYHGIATPAPPVTPGNGTVAAAQRGTPPPSYHDPQNIKRLDLPQPAFTSAQMQQTTSKYVGQNQEMYGPTNRPGSALCRPGTSGAMLRATSPLPMRSTSPRPALQPPQSLTKTNYEQNTSLNPYTNRITHQQQGQNGNLAKPAYQSYSRHGSPNEVRRAVSPQPQFMRQERPASVAGAVSATALQLSHGGGQTEAAVYGGGHRGRGAGAGQRPMSSYGGTGNGELVNGGSRVRSKSVTDGRRFTGDGQPILHFGQSIITNDSSTFAYGVNMSSSSTSDVHIPSSYPRGAIIRQGRCAGGASIAR